MTIRITAPTDDLPLTTDELAAQLKIRPHSIRKRFNQTGAYFCVRPVKLPNGRLMWPSDSLERLGRGH